MLVDRASIVIFADEGYAYLPITVILAHDNVSINEFVEGGCATLEELIIHKLRSTYESQHWWHEKIASGG